MWRIFLMAKGDQRATPVTKYKSPFQPGVLGWRPEVYLAVEGVLVNRKHFKCSLISTGTSLLLNNSVYWLMVKFPCFCFKALQQTFKPITMKNLHISISPLAKLIESNWLAISNFELKTILALSFSKLNSTVDNIFTSNLFHNLSNCRRITSSLAISGGK